MGQGYQVAKSSDFPLHDPSCKKFVPRKEDLPLIDNINFLSGNYAHKESEKIPGNLSIDDIIVINVIRTDQVKGGLR